MESLEDHPEKQYNKKAKLNRLDIFVLAFGAMIGWGWVVLTGEWISAAGTLGTVIAFVIGGVLVLFVGLVYAELASAMPETEGVLLFSKRALGRNAAFVCTWAVILGFVAVIAFESVALPTVVTYLFPGYLKGYLYTVAGFDIYATWLAVGIGVALLITLINIIGIKFAAFLQTVLTLIIMATGLILFGGTLYGGSTTNMEPLFHNGIKGIMTVLVMTPFMFLGFDVIPQAAGEASVAPRKIGKILVFSVIMSVSWYVLIVACVGAALPADKMLAEQLPTASAMQAVFGNNPLMGKLLVLGGISGIVTSWNAFYIGASRLIASMAQEGMLPRFLCAEHSRFRTPYRAIILIMAVTVCAPLLGRNMLVWLSDAGAFATVVAYLIVSVSFLVLRRKEPDMPRPYSVRRWKPVGIIAVLMCVFMLAMYMPGMPSALKWPYEWVIIGAWTLAGAVLALVNRFSAGRNSVPKEDSMPRRADGAHMETRNGTTI